MQNLQALKESSEEGRAAAEKRLKKALQEMDVRMKEVTAREKKAAQVLQFDRNLPDPSILEGTEQTLFVESNFVHEVQSLHVATSLPSRPHLSLSPTLVSLSRDHSPPPPPFSMSLPCSLSPSLTPSHTQTCTRLFLSISEPPQLSRFFSNANGPSCLSAPFVWQGN